MTADKVALLRPPALLFPLFAILLSSCGESTAPAAKSTLPAEPRAQPDFANGATITGAITFTGPRPHPQIIDMSAVPACERANAKAPRKSEDVVVNPNGSLRNVFVYVKDGLASKNWVTPTVPATLDQTGCMYEPHVLGIMTGQILEITNSDPTNHNIHVEPRGGPEWNRSQMTGSGAVEHVFSQPEVMLPVKCKIHPWMTAFLGVLPHPFFAVTGATGTFTIKGLPPGNYTLEAWQEKYGQLERQVAVGARESKTVDFSYR